jgi:hypothetical protein
MNGGLPAGNGAAWRRISVSEETAITAPAADSI